VNKLTNTNKFNCWRKVRILWWSAVIANYQIMKYSTGLLSPV